MIEFGGRWSVQAFIIGGDKDATKIRFDREWIGVSINPFNTSDEYDGLILTTIAPDDALDADESLALLGSTEIIQREIATFRVKPQLPRFRTSELHIDAVDSEGREVMLVIQPE